MHSLLIIRKQQAPHRSLARPRFRNCLLSVKLRKHPPSPPLTLLGNQNTKERLLRPSNKKSNNLGRRSVVQTQNKDTKTTPSHLPNPFVCLHK